MAEAGSAAAGEWWSEAVGYEVYIRSFADGNADGIGDLPGLLARLDHLTDLGVDVVWITPFYPSPWLDGGYDVADYTGVAAELGDLDDVRAVIGAAHERGMRVVVDVVPNHTSSQHPWFVASRSSRDDPHRGWYHWRDSSPHGGPPNNWTSVFGGPAWTFDDATGQWWLHQFLPEQPDLNWEHPDVDAAFRSILSTWVGRGVDGFRIDVAHGLAKHPDLPDLPPATTASRRAVGLASGYAALEHIHDRDQDAVLDLYAGWRAHLGEQVLLLGEVYLERPERVARYVRSQRLHATFWFPLQELGWDAPQLRESIDAGLEAGRRADRPGAATSWALESHDQNRAASRYGGGDGGRRRALALQGLIAALPGVPFWYQGQELGLVDGEVPDDRVADPIALRFGEPERGRDRSRTPMPWHPGPGLGFTEPGVEPWLPEGGRAAADTVDQQRHDADSWLRRQRDLITARRTWIRPEDRLSWISGTDDDVLAVRRGRVQVVVNAGASTVSLDAADDQQVVWCTSHSGLHATSGRVALDPDHAVWLARPDAPHRPARPAGLREDR